jgi:hypothetical protein
MKKLFFTVIFTLAVVTASFHAQVKNLVHPEHKINKSINMTISTDNNYSPRIYANSEAMLDYTIVKVRGRHIDTLMQSQYPSYKLRKLSSLARVFNQTIEIPNVADRKEQIVIFYTITYKTKGSVLKVQSQKLVARGVTEDQLCIHI